MTGIAGLTVSFLLIASIVSYIFIKSNANPIIKAALIITTIWYTVALYYAPQGIRGWAKDVDELPNNSVVLSYKIVEPSGQAEKGGIYFWVIENIDKLPNSLNPKEAFAEINKKAPRLYKVPYSRELHKRLEELRKKRGKRGVGRLIWKKGKKKGIFSRKEKRGQFKIVNPHEMLPSKNEIDR
jgi:hypothetical protein